MTRLLRPSLGLMGRVFAILLLAILIEFGASTFYYERASQLSVRDDEARRLAEHLVIARKLLAEEPREGRAALAADLTTSRYEVRWSTTLPTRLRIAPNLDRIHKQVVEWEPSLAGANCIAAGGQRPQSGDRGQRHAARREQDAVRHARAGARIELLLRPHPARARAGGADHPDRRRAGAQDLAADAPARPGRRTRPATRPRSWPRRARASCAGSSARSIACRRASTG